MSSIADVIDVLFIIGLLYGLFQLFPKRIRERTERVLLEEPAPQPGVREEVEEIPEVDVEKEKEAEAPTGTFVDYVKAHLKENLQVVERIAPGEPDLLVESLNFKEKFYIETWFLPALERKHARLGLQMNYLDDYRTFREESGRDIFFVVGVGGTETDPEVLYIIPLDFAEDFIPVERLKKFERPEPDLPIMYYYKKLR
jgi:hypothetical protein